MPENMLRASSQRDVHVGDPGRAPAERCACAQSSVFPIVEARLFQPGLIGVN